MPSYLLLPLFSAWYHVRLLYELYHILNSSCQCLGESHRALGLMQRSSFCHLWTALEMSSDHLHHSRTLDHIRSSYSSGCCLCTGCRLGFTCLHTITLDSWVLPALPYPWMIHLRLHIIVWAPKERGHVFEDPLAAVHHGSALMMHRAQASSYLSKVQSTFWS